MDECPTPETASRPLARAIDLAAVAAAAATLAGFAGRWHWLLDLTNHFRWYWLLGGAACLAAAAWQRSRLAIAAATVAVVANLWLLLPYWLPSELGSDGGVTIDLVSLNLLADTTDTDPAIDYLRQRGADVVVLLEVTPAWAEALAELESIYPHRVVEARADKFGVALLSQWPLDEPRVITPADGPPAIVAMLRREAAACRVIAAHPPAPISAAWSAWRDAQLDAFAKLVADSDGPTILAGDLNTTPWGHGFGRLLAASGLRDSALGRGIQPSWNAHRLVPRIPIDHVLVSPEIRVLSRRIGPAVGSDHLPVEARLVVP